MVQPLLAPLPESASTAATEPPVPGLLPPRAAPPQVPPADGRPRLRWPSTLPVFAWLLLHLAQPATWGCLCPEPHAGARPADPLLWYPPAGLGVALVAWFGPRAFLWMGLSALTAALQSALLGLGGGSALGQVLALLIRDMIAAAGAALAWHLYRTQAGGTRSLCEPRSAILFLFLIPGFSGVLVAATQALLSGTAPLGPWLLGDWLSWALGVLALAPPLLVLLTPHLECRGWVESEDSTAASPSDTKQDEDAAAPLLHASLAPLAERRSWGDWVEVVGLAVGTSAFSLMAIRPGRHAPGGWHLWGSPLLLIVWASMRQGLVGGPLSAAAATTVSALVLGLVRAEPLPALQLQGNLLAQCSTAVLVAASATWLRARETYYRQVITHIPVVLYSTRLKVPCQQPDLQDGERTGARPYWLMAPRSPSALLRKGTTPAEVTLVSAASQTLLGCPPQHLLGPFERWLERVHPEDRVVVRAALAQLERQAQPVTCEYRLAPRPPALSACRWVRDTLAPFTLADGRLVGWEGVLTDITEQRLLADDLRRTSAMLNALIANLPTGIFFVQGAHGLPLLVNARARQLLGREDLSAGLEQFPAVYRLFRPDGTPFPVEELPVWQALRQQRMSMRNDVVVHRADGRRIPLVTWAAPVALPVGGGPAAVWVLEDLTALHHAEVLRRDSEGRLRTILDAMAEGVVVQDGLGAVVDANPAAAALLGREPEVLRGKTFEELGLAFLREDGALLSPGEHPAHAALRAGRPVRNVLVGIDHDPRGQSELDKSARRSAVGCRWLLTSAMPLGSGPGAAGVVTTLADVTVHAQAWNLLRPSEQKYRGLVESLPLALVQADRTLRVTYGNSALRTLTGYDVSEIADPAVWEGLIDADDLPRVRALAAEARAGRPGRAEFRYRAKDGTPKVAFAITQPRWLDGEVTGTTTLILDLTRERQLEQDLQQAQRLELVGRLCSGIAHDFNNLLTVILSLADLARANLPPGHAAGADLQGIVDAAEQAANLSRQLLTLGKKRSVQAQRVELNDTVRRAQRLLRAILPAAVELQTDLAADELVVEADDTQLQQVVMNLCLNGRDAVLAHAGKGRLRVATSAEPGHVRLTVEDNGAGMSADTRAHLFDPFFSTKERGTGLGLTVVKNIVESYGGRIDVASVPGQGTRFDVWLPARAAEEQGAGSPATVQVSAAKM